MLDPRAARPPAGQGPITDQLGPGLFVPGHATEKKSEKEAGVLRLIRLGKKVSGEKGQALAEFALCIPVLLLLLVATIEVGHGMNSYLTVVDAARDGARLGSKGSASDDQIKALVVKETERLPATVSLSDITVQRNTVPGSPSVEVEVCYDHPLLMGVPALIPDPLRMCSTTTMPIAQ